MPFALFPKADVKKLAEDELLADGWIVNAKDVLKKRRMALYVSKDLKRLHYSYRSVAAKADVAFVLPLERVARVRVGLPAKAPPTGFFAAKPAAALSLVLESAAAAAGAPEAALCHLEFKDDAALDAMLRTLDVLCAYARARAGVERAVE